MKEFIKKWMLLFGLASITATVIPAAVNGYWNAAMFMFQLLFALLVICLLQLLTTRIPMRIPLQKYLIDLVLTLSVVLFFGWIWNWYNPSYIWTMFAMVVPAYVVGGILDLYKIKQDVKIINQQIERRREKMRVETGNE